MAHAKSSDPATPPQNLERALGGRGTLEKIHSPGNYFCSMHTQNWIQTKSSVSLPLMKTNGKKMGEAVRLNSLFGVHISRDIALFIQSIFLARQVLKISSAGIKRFRGSVPKLE